MLYILIFHDIWTNICENAFLLWSSDGSGVFWSEGIVLPPLATTEEHHQHVYGTFEHKLYRQISLPIYKLTYYLVCTHHLCRTFKKTLITHYYSHFLSKDNLHVIGRYFFIHLTVKAKCKQSLPAHESWTKNGWL